MAKVHMQALAITVALLVLLVALPSLAEPRAFDPQDLSVDTLNAGMPLDSVIASIGAPGDRQTTEEAATGFLLTTCQYKGLTLTFTDDALTGADWTGDRYIGLEGCEPGIRSKRCSALSKWTPPPPCPVCYIPPDGWTRYPHRCPRAALLPTMAPGTWSSVLKRPCSPIARMCRPTRRAMYTRPTQV